MIKILLIENQRWQFEIISRKLTAEEFSVLPDDYDLKSVNYFDFIEHVRVALNNRYIQARKDSAYDYIEKYIDEHRPSAIVMDHKLVGSYQSENGIDLALKIRKSEKAINSIPIVFLSRTIYNDSVVINALKENKIGPWIAKGYAGQAILDDDAYFKNVFIPALMTTISGHNSEMVIEDLNFLLGLGALLEQVKNAIRILLENIKDKVISKEMVDYIALIKKKTIVLREEDIIKANQFLKHE